MTQYHYLWLPSGADSKECTLHGPSVTRKRCFSGKGTRGLLCGNEVQRKGVVTLSREALLAAKPFLLENKEQLKARGFRLVLPKKNKK